MTSDLPVFSQARKGWTIQLLGTEGEWHKAAELLEDPKPCTCAHRLIAEAWFDSGRRPVHAAPGHLMRVLSQGSAAPGIPAREGDEESANQQTPDIRGGTPRTPAEERAYRDEQGDYDDAPGEDEK